MMRFAHWPLLLLACTIFTAQADFTVPPHPIDKVSDHVYVIHGPTELPNPENKGFINNPAVVVTSKGVVVIDPGSSLYVGRMVLQQIKSITDQPVTHVFNTHVHGDHWLGNHAIKNAFPDAVFYAHPEMIAQAKGGQSKAWIELMDNLTKGASKGTKAIIPAMALSDGQEIVVGDLTFRTYLSDHAHTKTDAMIEVINDSLMVLGDNALYTRIGRMDDGSFRGNIKALERALSLQLKHYVPGHGPSGGAEVVNPFKEYLGTVYEEAARLTDEGLSDFEMKDQIVAKLQPYQKWSGFDDEIGKHISLAVLEAEQAAFE